MGLQLKLNISNFSDEFCGGGSSVVALSSPSFSLLGGKKPGCYIGVAFSDGSVQLLLRDGLAQIASVELPRGGNIAWAKATLQRILYSNIYVYPFVLPLLGIYLVPITKDYGSGDNFLLTFKSQYSRQVWFVIS